MSDDLVISAPAPMAQFHPDSYSISDENSKILDEFRQRYTKILSNSSLRKYTALLKKLQALVDEHNLDELLAERSRLIGDMNTYNQKLQRLRSTYERQQDEQKRINIKYQAHQARSNIRSVKADVIEVNTRLRPYRTLLLKRDFIKQRIDEHKATVEFERQSNRDARQMQREANIHARLIVSCWDRLGYCNRIEKANRKYKRSVKIYKIISTPDETHFQIYVSRVGLFGAEMNTLPNGVSGYDLVKEETLRELSAATERQIDSPNTAGEIGYHKGYWLRLYRLTSPDGIIKNVNYRTVMARYPNDERLKYPLPLGVKSGRHINWQMLAEHPHLMVNGQTGSGKSNLMRVILSTLIEMHSPDEVRLVLIDLKRGGDFNPYIMAPHVIGGVVKDIDETLEIMAALEHLMEERMRKISASGTNDITKYNALVDPPARMPRIIVMFDEYTAIHAKGSQLANAIQAHVIMLATQARAAGIQLIIGNQQPYSDAVHKQIKANITLVFGGRQRTLSGSMSTFGDGSATKIRKIPGRMICDDGSATYQVQIPYLSDDEMAVAISNSLKWPAGQPIELTASTQDTSADKARPAENVSERYIDEEFIIRHSLEHHEGALKASRIFDDLKAAGNVSVRQIRNIINSITSNEEVEIDDSIYQVLKAPGNFFTLVYSGSSTVGQLDGVQLVDISQ